MQHQLLKTHMVSDFELERAKLTERQRIVMEAFSNVIQYAKATTVTVTACLLLDPARIQICISDNGVGLQANASLGQGLANMRLRAEAIGA